MDAPDRIGIAEMKHIEGLYAYWDALLAGSPVFSSTTAPRADAASTWRRSAGAFPLGGPTTAISSPTATNATLTAPAFPPLQRDGEQQYPKIPLPELDGRGRRPRLELNGTYNNASFNLTQAHEDIAEFKALRPYFYGDFYPLTEYSDFGRSLGGVRVEPPGGARRNRPGLPEASGSHSSIAVVLHDLEPDGDYEVTFEDYGITLIKNGRELGGGLDIKIPEAPDRCSSKYRRVR